MPEYVVLKKTLIAEVNTSEMKPENRYGTGDAVLNDEARRGERREIETFIPILDGNDNVSRVEAEGPDEAIDLIAQTDGDLKPGTYKAISWRNWAGVVTLKPKTDVDRQRGTEE